ncbi:MAG: phage holin family protein [Acetanaerobacterium sp.]
MVNDKAVKCVISIIAGWFASFFHQYGHLTVLVCIVIIFDVVTGILKAKVSGTVNSNAGFQGFWRKLSLFAGLSFGYFLDYFNRYLFSSSDTQNYSIDIPFGTIIGIYIILNESISILENLYICGVKLPTFICKALKTAGEQMDDDGTKK